MSKVKAIGLSLLFGLLSVAIVVAGFIVAAIVSVLTPIVMVFTGLWFIWFINHDFDDDEASDD